MFKSRGLQAAFPAGCGLKQRGHLFWNTLLYRALYFCFICCLCCDVRLDKTSIIFFSSVPEKEVVHRNYLIRNLMQRKKNTVSKEKTVAIHVSPRVPTLGFVAFVASKIFNCSQLQWSDHKRNIHHLMLLIFYQGKLSLLFVKVKHCS